MSEKVSVAMTTYNGAEYVEEQIRTILAQDYPVYEIVICDDGSTDVTVEIIRSIDCDKIRLYQNDQNLGYIKNFEKACLLCTGDVISLCDQDDLWAPNKVSQLVGRLKKNHSEAVFSNAQLIDSGGDYLKGTLWSFSMENAKGALPERFDYRSFYLANCVTGCTLMVRKDFLKHSMPFPESMPHDWWLGYVAAYLGGLEYCDEMLIQYRQHQNNTIGLGIGKKRSSKVLKLIDSIFNKSVFDRRLTRYKKWHQENLERFQRMYEFEVAVSGEASEEITQLVELMRRKMRGFSLEHCQEYFSNQADDSLFFLYGGQNKFGRKYLRETYEDGIARLQRKKNIKYVVAAIAIGMLVLAIN